jgi:ABC transporter substrate binding protein (PQQ-dependent alcohol dehydrogenase system)
MTLRGSLLALIFCATLPFTPARAENATLNIAYLALKPPHAVPASFLEQPLTDEGIQGARLGLTDNATTGRFVGQTWHLDEAIEVDAPAVIARFKTLAADGHRLFVTDLPAPLLLQVADLPEASDATILDATSADDRLRGADCRANVLHMLPSRAMLADALMQFLSVKSWRNLLLVAGREEADTAWADALRNAARKFRLKIVEDKPWTFIPGARRTDTGHLGIQAEVARFTQGISYDVLVVADEAGNFADEIPYRTTDPRPVAGSAGLIPTAWSKTFEQWGGTQLQSRFLRQANRPMTPHDYGAWMAVRAFGEAATRANTSDPMAMRAFMQSRSFDLAAFKGAKLSFRPWDGQLRQPVLLADDRALVSVSPQPGYLHEFSELDTLGTDRPETKCRMP